MPLLLLSPLELRHPLARQPLRLGDLGGRHAPGYDVVPRRQGVGICYGSRSHVYAGYDGLLLCFVDQAVNHLQDILSMGSADWGSHTADTD